jgi:molecular chaperone GrpE
MTQPTESSAAAPTGASAVSAEADEQLPTDASTTTGKDVLAAVALLSERVLEANRLSAERERVIDRLHAEVQQLRAGEVQTAIGPMVRDLIRLFDRLQQAGDASRKRVHIEPADLTSALEGFRGDVEDILFRNGIERFEALAGSKFDATEQRAQKAAATDEPARDGAISRVLRVGFRNEQRILRFVEVEVLRLGTTATASSNVTPEA